MDFFKLNYAKIVRHFSVAVYTRIFRLRIRSVRNCFSRKTDQNYRCYNYLRCTYGTESWLRLFRLSGMENLKNHFIRYGRGRNQFWNREKTLKMKNLTVHRRLPTIDYNISKILFNFVRTRENPFAWIFSRPCTFREYKKKERKEITISKPISQNTLLIHRKSWLAVRAEKKPVRKSALEFPVLKALPRTSAASKHRERTRE